MKRHAKKFLTMLLCLAMALLSLSAACNQDGAGSNGSSNDSSYSSVNASSEEASSSSEESSSSDGEEGSLSSASSGENSSEPETPAEYAIIYHVVYIEKNGKVNMDYCGTWEGYWQENLSKDSDFVQVPNSYKTTEGIEIPSLPTKAYDLNSFTPAYKMRGKLVSWFTDENCTQPFIGRIGAGSKGELHLYAKLTEREIGPL